jgi:hypothetical protein
MSNEPENYRKELEARVGKTWNTQELQEDFKVDSFMAPFVIVWRKSDGVKGTLMFDHSPRYYYGWQEE